MATITVGRPGKTRSLRIGEAPFAGKTDDTGLLLFDIVSTGKTNGVYLDISREQADEVVAALRHAFPEPEKTEAETDAEQDALISQMIREGRAVVADCSISLADACGLEQIDLLQPLLDRVTSLGTLYINLAHSDVRLGVLNRAADAVYTALGTLIDAMSKEKA